MSATDRRCAIHPCTHLCEGASSTCRRHAQRSEELQARYGVFAKRTQIEEERAISARRKAIDEAEQRDSRISQLDKTTLELRGLLTRAGEQQQQLSSRLEAAESERDIMRETLGDLLEGAHR